MTEDLDLMPHEERRRRVFEDFVPGWDIALAIPWREPTRANIARAQAICAPVIAGLEHELLLQALRSLGYDMRRAPRPEHLDDAWFARLEARVREYTDDSGEPPEKG